MPLDQFDLDTTNAALHGNVNSRSALDMVSVSAVMMFKGRGADIRKEAPLPLDINIRISRDDQANAADTDFYRRFTVCRAELAGEIKLRMPNPTAQIDAADMSITQSVDNQLADTTFDIERLHRRGRRLIKGHLGFANTAAQVKALNLQRGHFQVGFRHSCRDVQIERHFIREPNGKIVIAARTRTHIRAAVQIERHRSAVTILKMEFRVEPPTVILQVE